MSHIFISHSSKDKKYVRKLKDELHGRGFEAWVDSTIKASKSWWREIVKNLDICAAVIVVMTPEAEDSKWVEKEILLAEDTNKNIYPLLLRGQRFPSLIDKQYIDVTDGQMPPEEFYDALKEQVPFEAMPRLTQSAAKPAPAPSRKYSLRVGYQNYKGEWKVFAVDPRTIKIPEGRGYPSEKHLSMCVAPTGTRIALKRKKISNLAEVEQAMVRYG
jgi:hypothetical protein